MPELFHWRPLADPEGVFTHAILSSQFGDGYAQIAEDGINNLKQSWPLVFRGRESQIRPIKAFLDKHAGASAFLWTPPMGAQGHYVAQEGYRLQPHGGHRLMKSYTLAVTFKEAARP